MSVRLIHQTFDKQRQYFIGHYEDLNQCWRMNSYMLGNIFKNVKRVQSTLAEQKFITLLDDINQLEYRIEVD